MITRIAFIGHPTRNLDEAKKFYATLLGSEPTADLPTWAEFATPEGVTLALDTYAPKQSDHPTPYLALETDDLVAEVARLKQAGARFRQEPWANHDPDGNEVCHMAVLLDPDDNPVVLHQIPAGRPEI